MITKLSIKDISDQAALYKQRDTLNIYADDEIGPGRKVSMFFSIKLINDEIIDSNFGRKPVEFLIGDGNLLAGFEKAIFGLKAGSNKTITLPSADAFGEINEANFISYPRSQFETDLELEKGLMISFADAANNDQAGVVKDFDSEKVIVDFNHPLAGRDILFTVEILKLE